MSRRLGNHRIRPERSEANRVRENLARLDRAIAASIAKHGPENPEAIKLDAERAWALINSLVP